MENKIRYTLGKQERLKSRKAIEQLFKEGKSFAVYPFRILYILKKDQPGIDDKSLAANKALVQAGFTASSRNFKRAVDRNRIKRLMREAWRLQKHRLQLPTAQKFTLVLFFIYIGKDLPGYNLVYEKTTLVIKRLTKLMRESN
ncbi:MAG: ribonuclease P protein component [Ferruginibacter sp.]